MRNFCDHAVAFLVVWIDWFLNRIWIEFRQIYLNLLVILIYGFINMTYTWVSGEPVYAAMSWDSVGAWIMGLSILPIAFLFWVGLYFLTKCKFSCMKMHD